MSVDQRAATVPDFDPDALREKYRLERDKRLRAVRVGKAWMLRRSDYERWIAGLQGADACVPSVDDAAADLRRRGVI